MISGHLFCHLVYHLSYQTNHSKYYWTIKLQYYHFLSFRHFYFIPCHFGINLLLDWTNLDCLCQWYLKTCHSSSLLQRSLSLDFQKTCPDCLTNFFYYPLDLEIVLNLARYLFVFLFPCYWWHFRINLLLDWTNLDYCCHFTKIDSHFGCCSDSKTNLLIHFSSIAFYLTQIDFLLNCCYFVETYYFV